MSRLLNSLNLYFSVCVIVNKQKKIKKNVILECTKYFERNKHGGM